MSQSTTQPSLVNSMHFDSIEQEAYLQLWRTYDRLREIEERVFAEHQVTAQQYNALRVLKSIRPNRMTTSALGSKLVSRAADMTRLLDKLEVQGWVERARGTENRRIVEVAITAEGVALLQRLASEVRKCGRDQLGHMKPEALRKLIELLMLARQPHEDANAIDTWPGNRTSKKNT